MTIATRTWTPRTRWFIAVGYVVCWIAGLVVGGPTLPPAASAAAIAQEFDGSTSIVIFAVLVHGVAAVLIVALGLSLASRRTVRGVVPLAGLAAGLSLVQLAGEITLVTGPSGAAAVTIWEVITRVDGIKMIVLAALVVVVYAGRSRTHLALTIVSALTALALVASGIGYLALVPSLMEAAAASLPLLLVWALVATAFTASASASRASE
jgi:hypothetical protein